MKIFLLYALSLFLILIFLPAALVGGWWRWEHPQVQHQHKRAEGLLKEAAPHSQEIILKIYAVERGEIIEKELEEYLVGVVAAEMPASFHLEALKAQAVAARTYALSKAVFFGGNGCQSHPGAELCTDSRCCQAWEEERESIKKWPAKEASFYLEQIREAVRSTRNLVIAYQGGLISAVYHSTCGGNTEAAVEVWSGGEKHPYLQRVECPYCRHSPHYEGEVVMELSAYTAALYSKREALAALAEGSLPFLQIIKRSSSGRNLQVKVNPGGEILTGGQVREMLGLPSTHFQMRLEGEKIIFRTRGYGHGVGMCQYGADGMAKEGKDFMEILQYYFQGVEVVDYRFFVREE